MKPELHIVPASPPKAIEAKSTILEQGAYRAIVGEHPTCVYIAIANGCGTKGIFAEPVMALQFAKAIIQAAGKAIEGQYGRDLRNL
jgi:hypothetical protein